MTSYYTELALYLFLLLGPILLIVSLFGAESYTKKVKKKIETLLETTEIKNNKIVLPEPLYVEKGILKARVWIGFRGVLHASQEFVVSTGHSTQEINMEPSPYVLAYQPGEGYFEATGYRITQGEYENIVIVPLFPVDSVRIERDRLEVVEKNDYATLVLEPRKSGFSGLIEGELGHARKIRVRLKKRARNKTIEKTISKTIDSERIEYNLGRAFCLLIGPCKSMNLLTILEALAQQKNTPPAKQHVIMGHGEFEIELSLDTPFSRDPMDSTRIVAEPPVVVSEDPEIVPVISPP